MVAAALQAAINTPQSDRLKYVLNMTPRLIDVYFAIALRDVNDCMSILSSTYYFGHNMIFLLWKKVIFKTLLS